MLKVHPQQGQQQQTSQRMAREPPALEAAPAPAAINNAISIQHTTTKRKLVSMESYFDTPPSSPAPLVEAWPSSSSISSTSATPGGTRTRGGGIERETGSLLGAVIPTSNSISMRLLALAIHKALFGLFLCTFFYSIYVDVSRGRYNILSNWIYLTHWNLTFQVIFTTLELMSDYSSRMAERTAVFRAKFFHSIVSPYSFFVCASFWGMVAVDESLVRPLEIEDRCEEWYNQVVHTLIVPAALLEGLANYHRPSPLPEAFSITVVCGVIYIFWSIMWGILFDLWSYELFRTLTLGGFLLLVVGSATALLTLNLLGRTVHEVVWRSQRLLDARHQEYVLAQMRQAQRQQLQQQLNQSR